MKIPYENTSAKASYNKNYNGFQNNNPFEGSSEMDIARLTESVLDDDRNIGIVTSTGQVMPRNDAFKEGYKDGIELVKQRVWGGEAITDPEENVSVEIFYSEEALESILYESQKVENVETGGALVGAWERNLDGHLKIYVERATGPGPQATQHTALFSPQLVYYRSRIGYYRESQHWDYLGEWHKHPGSFNSLSDTDMNMAKSLITEEGWPMLLLPIVTEQEGQLSIDNNIVLSHQLGSRILMHIKKMDFEDWHSQRSPVKVYVDKELIEQFSSSPMESMTVEGIYNPDESYVFVTMPGIKNAKLRLVKSAKGEEVPLSSQNSLVTTLLTDNSIMCFHAHEGEIIPLESVIIDTQNSIYERNAGLQETAELRSQTVAIIGCGSLGSTLGLSLARAGVGSFYLFDFDCLSPANIARHQSDLSGLGRNKAKVLGDLIHRINPTLKVSANTGDIVNDTSSFQDFRTAASQCNLLICTTDTDDSRMTVNSVAVELKIKSLQVGLHERAASGIIHLYDPDSEYACFACHRRRLLSESSKRAEGIAYSEATDIRDLTVQPGLAAQINFVAEAGALRTIDALMGRNSLPGLTILYVDRQTDKDHPHTAGEDKTYPASERHLQLRVVHLDLERVPSCPVCGTNAFKDDVPDKEEAEQ